MTYALPTSAAGLRAASALSLCYSDHELELLLAVARDVSPVQALLAVPREDARRILAGLLPLTKAVVWAVSCAKRAQKYADADADAAAAYYAAAYYAAAAAAAYAADAAARAAAYAAAAAAYYAAAAAAAAYADAAYAAYAVDVEHSAAIKHGLALLLGGEA